MADFGVKGSLGWMVRNNFESHLAIAEGYKIKTYGDGHYGSVSKKLSVCFNT
jgi:hypothetical protein